MDNIITAVLALGGLGLAFGIVLAIASKKFCVKTDPRVQEVLENLPGANCGACGQAGCNAFANSLVEAKCNLNSCPVASEDSREKINQVLGLESEEKVKKVAALHCHGGNKVKSKFNYKGIETCHAANLVFGGPKECSWGCLGFGDCKAACPFGAITMQEGLPIINMDKCTACGKCVEACPKNLFSIQPAKKNVHVRCKSQDLGKNTRVVCSVGCIGCMLCQKKCPFDAIHVVDNLAMIDYDKCTACGACILVCPQKTIARK